MEQDRRREILQAAFDVIKNNGLPELSYDFISKKSGISRQLIRYYFATKDDFMIALCDLLASSYRVALVDVALKSQSSDRLKLLLDFYFDFLDGKKKPRDDQVYDAVMSLATGSQQVRENLRGQYTLLGSVVSHEVTIKYPQMSVADADQVSFLFVCLMYGHWKMVATLGLSEDHRHVTRRAVDRLIESYVRAPSKPVERIGTWSPA